MYQLKFVYDIIFGMHYELVPMDYQDINVKNLLGRVDQTRGDMRGNMRANNGKNK